jgi:hypothetical protein
MIPLIVSGQDMQNRTITKFTADINKNWYGVQWLIVNAKLETPNNINSFTGVGYKRSTWWFETMAQRQWSSVGNQVLLDFRFQKQFKKHGSIYTEGAPFLNRKAFYNFVIYEHPIGKKFNIGVETENVLKPGRDSLGFGLRFSRPIGSIGKTKVSAVLSFRVRPQEPDELRLYLIFNVPLRSRK